MAPSFNSFGAASLAALRHRACASKRDANSCGRDSSAPSELLLPELTNAVNLKITFRHALEQRKTLVDVKFDPGRWITTTSTIVQGGMDLTMADVDDYLVDSGCAEARRTPPSSTLLPRIPS